MACHDTECICVRCCSRRFDPNSTRFTLESVVSLRLDQHVDFIADLSVTASKEQAIETSLASIAATWGELALDMAEYKGTYKLHNTEDIFTALEDNGVTLSTMKASKYYLVFEAQVAHWERTLALASETVEMILQVGLWEDVAMATWRAWQLSIQLTGGLAADLVLGQGWAGQLTQ